MGVDGADADVQLFGNLSAALGAADQFVDFHLAIGEAFEVGVDPEVVVPLLGEIDARVEEELLG